MFSFLFSRQLDFNVLCYTEQPGSSSFFLLHPDLIFFCWIWIRILAHWPCWIWNRLGSESHTSINRKKRICRAWIQKWKEMMLWHCVGGAAGCWCRHCHGGGLYRRHHSCRGHCRYRQGAVSKFLFSHFFLLIDFWSILSIGVMSSPWYYCNIVSLNCWPILIPL